MATIRRNPTTTVVSTMDVEQPVQPAGSEHLNVNGNPDVPNLATYLEATTTGCELELGGFDFSAIPPGSIINSIVVRRCKRALSGILHVAATVDLKVAGAVRETTKWYEDTDSQVLVLREVYDAPNVTRDELATPGAFTIRSRSAHGKPPGAQPPDVES